MLRLPAAHGSVPAMPAARPPAPRRPQPRPLVDRLSAGPSVPGRRSAGWTPHPEHVDRGTDLLADLRDPVSPSPAGYSRDDARRRHASSGGRVGGWAERLPPALAGARWALPVSAAAVALVLASVVAALLTAGSGVAAPADPVPVPARTAPTGASPSATAPGAAAPSVASAPAVVDGVPGPAAEVVVHVVGQVGAPGLVRVPAGARVADAVAAAGGLGPEADASRVNLARPVVDGEQVLVPAPGEAVASSAAGQATTGPAAEVAGAPVDLNAASLSELDTLPGIGPVLAQRILDWRTEHGRFSAVDELGEVSGIGDKVLEQLRPLVGV